MRNLIENTRVVEIRKRLEVATRENLEALMASLLTEVAIKMSLLSVRKLASAFNLLPFFGIL